MIGEKQKRKMTSPNDITVISDVLMTLLEVRNTQTNERKLSLVCNHEAGDRSGQTGLGQKTR